MPVVSHREAPGFTSKNSGLWISRVIDGGVGSVATEVWQQILKPGELIPLHYHTVEETITVLAGSVEIEIDGETHTIHADRDGPSSALIPAMAHHEIRNVGENDMTMLAIFSSLEPEIFPVSRG